MQRHSESATVKCLKPIGMIIYGFILDICPPFRMYQNFLYNDSDTLASVCSKVKDYLLGISKALFPAFGKLSVSKYLALLSLELKQDVDLRALLDEVHPLISLSTQDSDST